MGLLDQALPAIGNAAKSAFNYLEGGAKNVAQDIGTGLGYGQTPGLQKSQNDTLNIAQQAETKANQTNDPAEKARLHQVAANAYQTVSQGAGQQAASYSPDVNQNPVQRGLEAGTQIATGADILAHPIATIKAPFQLIKSGIQAAKAAQNFTREDAGKVLPAIGNFIKNDAAQSFKLPSKDTPLPKIPNSQPNKFTKAGDRILASQYKGAERVVPNVTKTVGQLAEYGLTSPDKISEASAQVTGSADAPQGAILNKAVTRAAINSGPVNTGAVVNPNGEQVRPSMSDNLRELLNNTDTLTPNQKKAFMQRLTNTTLKATPDGAGPEGGDPEKLLSSLRNWEKQAQPSIDIHGNVKQNMPLNEKEIAGVYKGMANDLRQRIFADSGLNDQPSTNFLTPDDIATLKKIHPKLAQDAQNTNILGLRGLQARFVNGSKLAGLSQSFDESMLDPGDQILNGAAAFTGNPVLVGAAIARTAPGRRLIGNTLRGMGNMGGATTSGSSASMQLPPIVKVGALANDAQANPNENNTSNNGQNNSQNTQLLSGVSGDNSLKTTPNISNFDQNVNTVSAIPQTMSQLSQKPDGTFGIANIYSMTDQNKQPLFISPNQVKSQQLAIDQAKNTLLYKNSQAEQARVGSLQDQLDTQKAFTQQIADPSNPKSPYNTAVTKNNAYGQAILDAQQAAPDIANYNGNYDGFIKQFSNKYADLTTQLQILVSLGAINPQTVQIKGATLASALQTAAKGNLMQFYSTLSNVVGYTGQGQGVQTPAQTPQAANVPSGGANVPKGFNPMQGMNAPLPAINGTPDFQQIGSQF